MNRLSELNTTRVTNRPISEREVLNWCKGMLCGSAEHTIEEALDEIPPLDSLDDLPRGTRVLVRCDTNVVVNADGVIVNDSRIRSLVDTLRYGMDRGWVQVIHGHMGVDGRESLQPVANMLEELLNTRIKLIGGWMDDNTGAVDASATKITRDAPECSVFMLENARRYELETALWRPQPELTPPLLRRLACYANSVRQHVARVHINEGFAASNADLSSCLVPLAMERVALGFSVRREFSGPVRQARCADVVIFSGAKMNKLLDLLSIVQRRKVRLIVVGGLLALPLLYARNKMEGQSFEVGLDFPEVSPSFPVAEEVVVECQRSGIELQLPKDFVLTDGRLVAAIPSGSAQRDIGPESCAKFSAKLNEHLQDNPGAVIFHNGCVGQFEQDEFSSGTRSLVTAVMQLHSRGASVFVGGGESQTALIRFGSATGVTHCFTAGTTILKALGVKPIPYLWALSERAVRSRKTVQAMEAGNDFAI